MIGASKILIIFSAIAAGAFGATAILSENVTQNVAGHRYAVPKDHLFNGGIFFLPQQSDAFTFLFEPNSDPDIIPKHRVLVQDLSLHCPTALTTDGTQMLRIVCGQEDSSVREIPPFFELGNKNGSWSSDLYAGETAESSGDLSTKRKVAYCRTSDPTVVNPESQTLCTTFWAYDGMMLQFSFDAKESSEMPAMKRRAEELLETWKIR